MRTLGIVFLALAVCVTPLFGGAQAAAFPPTVSAIVDVQRILQESLAARSVQRQLESQRVKYQSQIANEEKGLREAEEELAKVHGNVAPDVYAVKEQELRQKFMVVERHVQSRRKALEQANTDSMNVVRNNVLEIVARVAKEHGANVVIVKQQILWADSQIDVTDEVLAKLNKALPEVNVKVVPEEDDKTPTLEKPKLLKH